MRPFLTILAVLAGLAGLFSPASAELLVYSAADFMRRCPLEGVDAGSCPDPTEFHRGVLYPQDGGRYYASIAFPVNGQRVCRFTLVYHDINGGDAISAVLARKIFFNGSSPINLPLVMAFVASAPGVSNTVRFASTADINSPQIIKGNSFYFVEVFAPTVNLNFLGVQIDVRPNCPLP